MEVYFRNVQFQNKRKMMHGTYLFREKTTDFARVSTCLLENKQKNKKQNKTKQKQKSNR